MPTPLHLTPRERQILELLRQGKSNKLIGLSLGISDRTVEFHLRNVYAKAGVGSRMELILTLGQSLGIVPAPNPGLSPVTPAPENSDNGTSPASPLEWAKSLKAAVSVIGQELIMKILIKKPSAFLPPAMSFAALAIVLVHLALFGLARQPDEGTAAHLWQLLMAAQLPIIAFFTIRWLPQAPIKALAVLALQGAAALAALAPVFLLKL